MTVFKQTFNHFKLIDLLTEVFEKKLQRLTKKRYFIHATPAKLLQALENSESYQKYIAFEERDRKGETVKLINPSNDPITFYNLFQMLERNSGLSEYYSTLKRLLIVGDS